MKCAREDLHIDFFNICDNERKLNKLFYIELNGA